MSTREHQHPSTSMSSSFVVQVGAKERCLRSLMGFRWIRQFFPDLALRLCHPERSRSLAFEIDVHGYRYSGTIKNQLDWCAYFLRDFATAEANFLSLVADWHKRRGQPFVCLDLGANVGIRTLAMARVADDVIAFEPVREAYERVAEQLRTNKLHHVQLVCAMMSDQAGEIDLDVLSPNNFLAVTPTDTLMKSAFGRIAASAVRGDDFLQQDMLPLPNFIRIDARIESISALRGLAKTLRQTTPIILIERPAQTWARVIDDDKLRSVLYDDVDLATFNESVLHGTFSIEPLDPEADKLICFPKALRRAAQYDACKAVGLGMAPAGLSSLFWGL